MMMVSEGLGLKKQNDIIYDNCLLTVTGNRTNPNHEYIF